MLYFTSTKILDQKYDEINTLLSVLFEQNREDLANEIFAEQQIALQESLKDILAVRGIAGVGLYDKKGILILSTGTDFIETLSQNEMQALDETAVFEKRLKTNKSMASYSSMIEVIGEQLGYIKTYYNSKFINKQLNQVIIVFITFFMVLTIFIPLLLNTLLSRFIIKPVLTLKQSMEKLDNGIFGIKVDLSARDEIGEMGAVFNKMSNTLLENHTALESAVQTETEYALKLVIANKEFKRVNAEIEKSNNALAQLNIDLEKTVEKRTAALVESNASLQREMDEKEKMQEDLVRVEKLESTALLAGGIAHDFNNILSIIIGNISLAQLHAQKGENISNVLVDTEKACFRARDLTKQLLTFSKGGSPVKKTMPVTELIKETVIFALRGSNVGYHFSITPDLCPVNVDEGQINQAISNIVINASHAMAEGGTVMVTAENITIELKKTFFTPLFPGSYIRISIQDTGTGIAKKNLQSIFDPYFTTKPTGSGLGLATAHSIIEKHEGFINVHSQEAMGTIFNIYLPASLEKIHGSIAPTNGSMKKCPKGHGKILIMDDEEMIRTVVGELLKHMGYDPDFAEDGAEACKKYLESMAKKEKFNAVIMDLTIPGGMGGKEAVQHILKIDPQAKVIVSSGFSTDPVMADYKSYGFSGVVAKPFMVQELSAVLREVI
ncbi:MAG: ATP-binding protein [Desulfobacterium sp.]